jgi:hypothetical protein
VREATQAIGLAQGRKAVHTTGQDLVRIALVANIPDHAVALEIEDLVQGDGELDHAEIATEVSAGLLNSVEQEHAHLLAQSCQLFDAEAIEITGRANALEQGTDLKRVLGSHRSLLYREMPLGM